MSSDWKVLRVCISVIVTIEKEFFVTVLRVRFPKDEVFSPLNRTFTSIDEHSMLKKN